MKKTIDIEAAYWVMMDSLFDVRTVPAIRKQEVTRSRYTEAMEKAQEEYGLTREKEEFAGWIFLLISRSPIIIEDTDGDDDEEGDE